ncbi:MAG: DUF5009 domain-containing protein [Bacteroidetes bacterium]|nr:MAG: DUF5009 domain-containing protein [Bacteroidota bacterium]
MTTLPRRLSSIDVFRAITMLLMIFVNDLWSLHDIPGWLEHTHANDDGMGLADTIFPAFLFIVGLSIPFAIQSRQSRGESSSSTAIHILIRSVALLIMGVFHVNLEDYSKLAIIPKPIFQILVTVAFFLVWLDYPETVKKSTKNLLKGLGIALLIALAIVYKGDNDGTEVWMRPQWYGILGIIGWSYLLGAGIYFLSNGKLGILIAALVFFYVFNIATHAGWLSTFASVRQYVWIISGGSSPALVMGGIVVSVIYRQLSAQGKQNQYLLILAILAVFMTAFGFLVRPLGGISKIKATPSWTAICTGISIACFVILIYIVDLKGKKKWFDIIKPAGTSTLTCYLLPYIIYAFVNIFKIDLPLVIRTGLLGLAKSMAFALIVIILTGVLEKWKIRLKI